MAKFMESAAAVMAVIFVMNFYGLVFLRAEKYEEDTVNTEAPFFGTISRERIVKRNEAGEGPSPDHNILRFGRSAAEPRLI